MSAFLLPKENIVIGLMCEWMGESRFNRSMDEYVAMASKLPKIEALYTYVNQRLAEMAREGVARHEISYFKPGDRHIWYEKFPRSLSRETVRKAVKKFFGDLLQNP